MDKNQAVMKLIYKIVDGKCTVQKTEKAIDRLERKYGKIDILCEIEDRLDEAYFNILLDDARCGIFSRQSILKLAAIREPISRRYVKIKRTILLMSAIGIVICMILLIKCF